MYLAHHRDTPPDGERSVMMYGYGILNWTASPWFRSHLAEWMSLAGSFALRALRGGGGYGEAWRQAGIRHNRQNAIDDYLAAAQWLLDQGLVRPERLVAETNSAGASLVDAAMVQRPDLFGAALIGFPLLDLLHYEQSPHGPRWRADLGSVENPEDFEVLRALSPVHNIEPEACYPAVMLTPGEVDETTPAVHAYKFAAALQFAQSCDNPVLLRVSWNAGHWYGSDEEASAENFADRLAFLKRTLDLPEVEGPPARPGIND